MNEARTNENKGGIDYGVWAFITGGLGFIAIWIYAISQWGLLLGLVFGWIPALIGGFILGLLWPIVALAIVGIVILIYSQSNQPKTTKTSTQQFNTRVTTAPTNKPYRVGIIDNTKTLIVCNYGNKKTLTATQAKVTFVDTDFKESYLPDNKRVALQKVCQISQQELEAGLNDIWNDKDITPLFEVKPVYK